MAAHTEEKRIFPRVRNSTLLRCQIRGRQEFTNAIGEDLSLGGLSFNNNRFIPKATTVNLEISLLSRILNPIGKVTWASPIPHSDRFRLGVEFVEMDPQDKKFLSDYMDMQTNQL